MTLSLAVGTQRSLVERGVSIDAVKPATTNGVSSSFPTVQRRGRPRGVLVHHGELRLVGRGGRVIALRRLHTVRLGRASYRATGKPVVTTEIGQYGTEPAVVTGHLTRLIDDLHLPFVIWFDADGIPAHGLHDGIGHLRANGQAFRDFVASHRALLR